MMARGNRREDIVRSNEDRGLVVDTLFTSAEEILRKLRLLGALQRRAGTDLTRIVAVMGLSSGANASNRIRAFERSSIQELPKEVGEWRRKYEI